MSAFVLDASTALTWCFPLQETALSRAIREMARGASVHVPGLWYLEIAHALVRAERKGDISRAKSEEFLGDMRESMRPFEDDAAMAVRVGRVTDLAREYGLSAYDAAYLELALRKRVSLATHDQALRKAARRAGVPLVDEEASPTWEAGEAAVEYGVKKKKVRIRSKNNTH